MAMLTITEILPIEEDVDSVLRVSKTRVTLDTLIAAFKDGATAEEIAQQYPTVPLADVYSVIGYYLRRSAKVEAYLRRRSQQAETINTENSTRFSAAGVRERLLARATSRSV